MIVLPAPGSSASRNRSGWRGSISWYTAVIWCGKRIDDRGVHREHRVEQMGEADAMCLGHEAEEGSITVETPRPPALDDLEPRLVVPVEQLVGDLPGRPSCRSVQALPSRTTGR